MDDFATFLRDCTRDDLASMPLKCMSPEQIVLLGEEISHRNEEDLKHIKKQIKENK